ncbi:MAG: DUF3006 domain-containing protein [bacterium]|nr:DUF3006 domain-containing protein [bacterium]
MQVTVDRFENDIAVIELENGETIRIPRTELPEETAEGDVLDLTFGSTPTETDRRAQRAKDILNELLSP